MKPTENKKRTVIFVASAAYSGSTMLDLMLSNSKTGFSCGEVSALFRPWRPGHLHPKCGCGDSNCRLWERVRERGEHRLYEQIFEEFPDIDYVVDSSKDLAWLRDQYRYLSNNNLEKRFVLLWKTPLEYAYSCWKRDRDRYWIMRWTSYYKRLLSVASQWISIPYRDLARSPAETLKHLCDTLDIAYHDGQENFWERTQHTLWGSGSVRLHYLKKGTKDYLNAAKSQAKSKPNIDADTVSEIKHYREIYYDDSYLQKLPQHIRRSAKDSADLTRLVALFQETDFRSSPDPDTVHELLNNLRPSPIWYWRDRTIDRVLELAARAGIRIM